MYIHLHGHSHYSLLEAIGKVGKILDKAKELEYPAIAISDYNGMYGIMEFYTKAKKAGIKPICGIELTVTNVLGKKADFHQYVVLLVKNYEGYKNLMKITTIANTKGLDGSIPTIDFDTLQEYASGMLCMVGGPKSIIGSLLLNTGQEDNAQIQHAITKLKSIYPDSLYLEIIAQNKDKEPAIHTINNQIISLSQTYNLPLVVNSNFHYVSPKDETAFETALCIKDQKHMTDPTRRKLVGQYHIMSETEVRDILLHNGYSDNQIQQRFDENQAVCDMMNLELPPMTPKFPLYKTPQEFLERFEKMKTDLVVV